MEGINLEYLKRFTNCKLEDMCRIGKEAFCLESVPIEDLTEDDLNSWYSELHTTISMYESAKKQKEISKEELDSELEYMVDNILQPYEFQSACFILKENPENKNELKIRFLNELYGNSDKYSFFIAREKVIDKLISLNAIKESGYKKD